MWNDERRQMIMVPRSACVLTAARARSAVESAETTARAKAQQHRSGRACPSRQLCGYAAQRSHDDARRDDRRRHAERRECGEGRLQMRIGRTPDVEQNATTEASASVRDRQRGAVRDQARGAP